MNEKLKVDFVWKKVPKKVESEVIDFWISTAAITSREKATKRVKELVGTCRDENGHLVAVSTHVKYFYPPLQNHFHLSRTFVKEGHRQLGVMKQIFQMVWSNFNEKQLYKEEGIVGVLAVMENEHLNKSSKPIWDDLANGVLVGFDSRGFQIRVGYFEGAELSLPKRNQGAPS
ncbi:MAG: hypothetical protein ABJP45_01215 [Cyclobacteriaceae bacterium]